MLKVAPGTNVNVGPKMLTVRLSADTLTSVNEAARRAGVSQNQWCLTVILRALNERGMQQMPELGETSTVATDNCDPGHRRKPSAK